MNNHEDVKGFGAAAGTLAKLLADAAGIYIEPYRLRKVTEAKVAASQQLTTEEIRREEELAAASYRAEILEVFRERNLRSIAALVSTSDALPSAQLEPDWLAAFVESCKDTSDSTLQAMWAKLMAGELEGSGRCSKRTMQMVKGLSRDEGALIKQACQRICIVEDDEGDCTPFLNVIIRRNEARNGIDDRRATVLFEDSAPDRRKRNQRLIACGFLSADDYTFGVRGEGYIDRNKFHLSSSSPRFIKVGESALNFAHGQPGLLSDFPPSQSNVPSISAGSAEIEFDAWKLSPEGVQLFDALAESFDSTFVLTLRHALEKGGLSVEL